MNTEELNEIIFPKKTFNIFKKSLKEISCLSNGYIDFNFKDLEDLYAMILQDNFKNARIFNVGNQQKSFDTIIRFDNFSIAVSLKSKIKKDNFFKVYEMAQLDKEISKLRHSKIKNKDILIIEKIVNLFNDRYKEEDIINKISNRFFLCFEKDEKEIIISYQIQDKINLLEIEDIKLESNKISFKHKDEIFFYEFRNSTLYQTRNEFKEIVKFKYSDCKIPTRKQLLRKIIEDYSKEEI